METSDTGVSAFQEMSAGTERKYIMVSGKGGVGKTSLAASLAVRFAQEGHTTLVVSTDPAHSLGDSLAQVRRQAVLQGALFNSSSCRTGAKAATCKAFVAPTA
jgi:CO dehydrogenase nickel-insertion accessory protein CooC1